MTPGYPSERSEATSENLAGGGGPSAARIAWLCDRCRQPIADGDGLIAADRHAALARLVSTGDEYTPRVPWVVAHHGCDTGDNVERYRSPIEQWRTPTQILQRVAEVTAKAWAAHTDLAALLGRARDVEDVRGPRVPARSPQFQEDPTTAVPAGKEQP